MNNNTQTQKSSKKSLAIAAIIIAALVVLWALYAKLAAPTKVALVNFPNFQTTSIAKSNTDGFIKVNDVSIEELDKLTSYDAVLVFAMGIRLSADQRAQIQSAADKGVAIYSTAVTNPENNICSLDSVQLEEVKNYLNNGNKKNYNNLLRYIRAEIDKKTFFVEQPEKAVETSSDVLYHIDDEQAFASVAEYETYYREKGFFKEKAPKIAIVGGMSDPFSGNRAHLDSLIISLEKSGANVYPISSVMKRLEFFQAISPDAVIYMPHGRMSMGNADQGVDWLKSKNIPLFCPLTIIQPETDWMDDQMGMMGGFLSQSVVMPELDGGIYPYVVNAQYIDNDGYYIFRAIPDRLNNFVEIINNFLQLKHKTNSEKKVAIYYFKGAGQSALAASGMEVLPSLYRFLKRLQAEGYKVDNLPTNEADFAKLVMQQGSVLGTYAKGAFDEYLAKGKPALVEKADYENWTKQALMPESYQTVVDNYGEFPGEYMNVHQDGKDYLAVARIQLGNIVLLPQPMAGLGDNTFQIVHGAKTAPPHTYVASYLWSRYSFNADAMLHFGTHGSLEFTPQKQVALSSADWPDRLVGTLPHFYLYTIGNVGEGVIAKRRSYATLVSYITPPFMESETRGQFKELSSAIEKYYATAEGEQDKASLTVKKLTVQMGIHRDLQLDSVLTQPYNADEIARIENFAEEIANEKMTGQYYTLGVPYEASKIESSVMAMSADPIAYSVATLDKLQGKVTDNQLKNKAFFTKQYLNPAKTLVNQVLKGQITINDDLLAGVMKISAADLQKAHQTTEAMKPRSRGMMGGGSSSASAAAKPATTGHPQASGHPGGGHPSGHPAGIPKTGNKPESAETAKLAGMPTQHAQGGMPKVAELTKEDKAFALAVQEIERTVKNIVNYKNYLQQCPQIELSALVNALNGGYIAPSAGGDAVANPNALPTGRNLYSINAEATPSESAWTKGVSLAQATLEQYKKQHGEYPKKVSYTFWSSEFIETEGATIAQVLYMLGVEPVRDMFGRVSDLRLISNEELARPRVDVVVQTSGQFRDLAASRLVLINRAIEMAAAAPAGTFNNFVAEGTVEMERQLVESGVSPKEARELSTYRVFGGINGNYGTGITGMVESGDRWESEQEIAAAYLNNMGAVYGTEKDWGQFRQGLLKAALHNTDIVVQPRQSNTWGALSLDHVYEFMGGLNLTVRNVTGKDPDAYFSDYRNRNNVRMQELKEAIGVEARSTVFNPAYIKEQMKGGASNASQFSEVVRNTYGWNVMKPNAIDNELWDKLYDVYVQDEFNLGVKKFFKDQNPAALQEMSAVMMETARKGYWEATPEQLQNIAVLHADLVKEFGASGSSFVTDNAKLKEFIANNLDQALAQNYTQQIAQVREVQAPSTNAKPDNGLVMKKEEVSSPVAGVETSKNSLNGWWVGGIVAVAFIGLVLVIRQRRKKNNE